MTAVLVLFGLGLLSTLSINGHPFQIREVDEGIKDDPAEVLVSHSRQSNNGNDDKISTNGYFTLTPSVLTDISTKKTSEQQTPLLSSLYESYTNLASSEKSKASTHNVIISVATSIQVNISKTTNDVNFSMLIQPFSTVELSSPKSSSLEVYSNASRLMAAVITESNSLSAGMSTDSAFNDASVASLNSYSPSAISSLLSSSINVDHISPATAPSITDFDVTSVPANISRNDSIAQVPTSSLLTTESLADDHTNIPSLISYVNDEFPSIDDGFTNTSFVAKTNLPSLTTSKFDLVSSPVISTVVESSAASSTAELTLPSKSSKSIKKSVIEKSTVLIVVKNTAMSWSPSTSTLPLKQSTDSSSTAFPSKNSFKYETPSKPSTGTSLPSVGSTTIITPNKPSSESYDTPKQGILPPTEHKVLKTNKISSNEVSDDDNEIKKANEDEGKMPPPDQGREAVLWDFIVPVGIGTLAALVIALGMVMMRSCRRRKLIKVRFGGKPSHPRLLNNDLINLLAESDDEE
ncbi:topoisomerase I damage affected protein 7-like isoform X2 [Xenia sp. Carnegie-2017]|uniref:topoisomerase I damage affected protein 7-like isoform X2 n=1 Tax=Xenia sp. Carnegie-2017 TaxID=2897299 RepID=UPI001F0469A5|nr:topoisomerase I damage affected protein 7-like isoform X2 [Xenia sp. Carnegie-2017]